VSGERDLDAVNRAYVTAVRRAGGLPLLLPVLEPEDVADVLATIDCLLLTGGGDIDPMTYGEAPAPEVYGVDPARDRFEIALFHAAVAAGVPVLGICRGAQVINVASGGTLVQDLPTIGAIGHREIDHPGQPVHEVSLLSGSVLAGILGAAPAAVNSLHHQSVAILGNDLRTVAWSDDGTVEALESSVGDTVVAVQWHPELLPRDPRQAALFSWLVGEAGKGRAGLLPDEPRTLVDA
jgi:putative glutamine amidotransferase